VSVHNIQLAIIPLLYSGLCSVGIAYTLQTLGQRHSKPSHSAVILSLESVFSCLGGAVILGENLGPRGYFGCALMITGMILSQMNNVNFKAFRQKLKKRPYDADI
jgi:drug/metabolite transporter (DMT)-like permease